jgi:hypothetical protein
MRQFVLSFEAEEDILRIFEYGLANFGLNQAEKYYDMLFECFKKIGSNPFLFPAANEIKKEYQATLSNLAEATGKTVEELDKEISEQIENCKNIEDIMIKSSEIFDE